MGKTRDLFKKIRDTKGTYHAKMGSIKDRNGMDLTEAEDIKGVFSRGTTRISGSLSCGARDPVAIRRGEGAQMKLCRDSRCSPRRRQPCG